MPGETIHKIGVVVIDQLSQFTSFRAAETFFEPLQLHLQPPDLSWIVVRPQVASSSTLALNSRHWVWVWLFSTASEKASPTVEAPLSRRCPASGVNDEGCPEQPDPLNRSDRTLAVSGSWKGADDCDQQHLQHRITGGWVVAIPVVTAAAGRILRGRSSAPVAAKDPAPLVRPRSRPHSGTTPANRPPGIP